ncbi:hypothetical protein ZIOFF_042014 [Zingiber officinale]|uniref:Uncharacterized protein n=1 Tax=Zingiber officinale TaxID=94328 RepID=A0A8J5G7H7_ZINOF|nr:hypothetical protein ZIOFF_042014 [Zingiber officinale]
MGLCTPFHGSLSMNETENEDFLDYIQYLADNTLHKCESSDKQPLWDDYSEDEWINPFTIKDGGDELIAVAVGLNTGLNTDTKKHLTEDLTPMEKGKASLEIEDDTNDEVVSMLYEETTNRITTAQEARGPRYFYAFNPRLHLPGGLTTVTTEQQEKPAFMGGDTTHNREARRKMAHRELKMAIWKLDN